MKALLAILIALMFAPTARAGYSYATLTAPYPVRGLAATLTMTKEPRGEQVASWVGVGNRTAWLQAGIVSPDNQLYVEANSGGYHFYRLAPVTLGEHQRVAIVRTAPNLWIAVTSAGILGPFYLPHSNGWSPEVAAEGFGASAAQFTFGGIETMRLDGSWHLARRLEAVCDAPWHLRGLALGSFAATIEAGGSG